MKNIMICSLLLLQAGMIFAADAGQTTPRGQESNKVIQDPNFGIPRTKKSGSSGAELNSPGLNLHRSLTGVAQESSNYDSVMAEFAVLTVRKD